ncbi:cation:proton antiporter [Candidatus Woesearchaeota archaeon]|nr:cation:proton antiporter [Candidatus Woesearchaeota archaeon]
MPIQSVQEIGVLFIIIAAISFVIKLLRQPIIIGYILSGLVVSLYIPVGSETGEQIRLMSEIGIMFLLFLMGLELDISNLKQMGKDIFIATLLQSLAFFGAAFGLAIWFGLDVTSAVYIAILFMFSSTLLVAKWVEDKKETMTVAGKLTLGTLIVQDLLAIISITLLNVFMDPSLEQLLSLPIKGIALLVIAYIASKYVLKVILRFASRFTELLFVVSLSVCFFFVFIAPFFGYSATIGAFMAGVVLANTDYKNDIYVRLKPLILFFNILFFVGFGFQVNQDLPLQALYLTGILLALALFLKPVVIYITLKLRGYDMKTSTKVGLNLAQVSEFGAIIVAGGIAAGAVPEEIGAISVILLVTSMVFSSYYIKYANRIFGLIGRYVGIIDRLFKNKYEADAPSFQGHQVVFFGFMDFGKEIFSKLEGFGKKVVVVENDPSNISYLKKEGIPFIYNSLANPYFLEHFDFKTVELVISSLLDNEENKLIITHVKAVSPKAVLIVTAKNIKSSLDLYDAGADYVIYPSYINEQSVNVLVEDYTLDINKIITRKVNDLNRLKEKSNRLNSREDKFNINDYLGWLNKK